MSQPPRATRPDDVVGETTTSQTVLATDGPVDSATLMKGRRELIIRHGADTYRLQDHRFQQADPHEVDQRVRTPESHPFPVKLPSQPILRGS